MEPWRYVSMLELKYTTKNTSEVYDQEHDSRIDSIYSCIPFELAMHMFSDRHIQVSMTIYNFRCPYNILDKLEEHSTSLVTFRYIAVYILWRP